MDRLVFYFYTSLKIAHNFDLLIVGSHCEFGILHIRLSEYVFGLSSVTSLLLLLKPIYGSYFLKY